MRRLIAAIDNSAAALPVLTTARLVAQLFGDSLFALHVSDEIAGHTAADAAAALDIPLDVRHGDVVTVIASAASAVDVCGVVVGSRELPTARRAVGHVALALIQMLDKPVVVVPPTANHPPDRLQRLLVPLDGTGETAAAVQDTLGLVVADADLDVIALHVFESDSIPMFSDQTGHETEAWREEFLRRWLPDGDGERTLETRVGRAADVVRAVVRDVHADLVAVGWKQDLARGRAQVVEALLADAAAPVVLLPLSTPATGGHRPRVS